MQTQHADSWTWTVYHGGEYHGLGIWESGTADTSIEAFNLGRRSRRDCEKVIGGSPFVVVKYQEWE